MTESKDVYSKPITPLSTNEKLIKAYLEAREMMLARFYSEFGPAQLCVSWADGREECWAERLETAAQVKFFLAKVAQLPEKEKSKFDKEVAEKSALYDAKHGLPIDKVKCCMGMKDFTFWGVWFELRDGALGK